jgi:hypothetical protein
VPVVRPWETWTLPDHGELAVVGEGLDFDHVAVG